ncbi:hypothetical protein BU16DRAFT_7365 [Lophium mytilinum]|uniref:Uncharacterized protein n=1 Tax=Lophium mytilinum TaxID=390894 RepID=A0A6A6RDD4_9PEZI|nr:hypothetical protein BU16DRAFT_7365 [Lophium mytilinum]
MVWRGYRIARRLYPIFLFFLLMYASSIHAAFTRCFAYFLKRPLREAINIVLYIGSKLR